MLVMYCSKICKRNANAFIPAKKNHRLPRSIAVNQLRLLYGDMRLEEATNDIALDVYWARLDLGLESLVAETIPTTFEVCIDAAIGLDDIKAEDL